MTITLQAVNELISSLESAGELSIREQKFLKLAKAYQQLAAENAGLKGTLSAVIDRSNEPDYQSIGMGCGVEDNGLQTDGYNACEYGWLEAMDRIYSEVIPDTIPETPATDAFLAEVRAQGVEMLVKHCEQKALEKSYDFFMDAGAVAAQFAAQLRQEAQ